MCVYLHYVYVQDGKFTVCNNNEVQGKDGRKLHRLVTNHGCIYRWKQTIFNFPFFCNFGMSVPFVWVALKDKAVLYGRPR